MGVVWANVEDKDMGVCEDRRESGGGKCGEGGRRDSRRCGRRGR